LNFLTSGLELGLDPIFQNYTIFKKKFPNDPNRTQFLAHSPFLEYIQLFFWVCCFLIITILLIKWYILIGHLNLIFWICCLFWLNLFEQNGGKQTEKNFWLKIGFDLWHSNNNRVSILQVIFFIGVVLK